jgi:RHS repeat-associated protein
VQTKIGIKYFELSNHASAPLSTGLGNVLKTISDRKIEHGSGSTVEYYTADIISATDYYPFGFAMDERNFSSSDYRFGFNGMEKDDEFTNSTSHYDFGARIYDSRVGRFLSVDPKYNYGINISVSSYQFANNTPIIGIDKDGEFLHIVVGAFVGAAADLGGQMISNARKGVPLFEKIDWADVAISSGEGAVIAATAGVGAGITEVIASTLRTSVDWTTDGLTTDDIIKDGVSELIGIVAGRLFPDKLINKNLSKLDKKMAELTTRRIVKGGVKKSVETIYDWGVDVLSEETLKQFEPKTQKGGVYRADEDDLDENRCKKRSYS